MNKKTEEGQWVERYQKEITFEEYAGKLFTSDELINIFKEKIQEIKESKRLSYPLRFRFENAEKNLRNLSNYKLFSYQLAPESHRSYKKRLFREAVEKLKKESDRDKS